MPLLRVTICLFFLVLGLGGLCRPGQAGPTINTEPQIFRLQNGLTVLILEDTRFPLVSVRLYAKAGSAWESPQESGISHFLEHMVFKGSETCPGGVEATIENAGGYLNAYTSHDNTVYVTDLPSNQWQVALEGIRDLAFAPLLHQEDVDAEREVILAEMKQRGDNPHTRLSHTIFSTALSGSPYELPIIGTTDTLRAITPDSMREYIQRRYDPMEMLLVVVGNIRAEEVLSKTRELYGSYTNHNTLKRAKHYTPQEMTFGLQVKVCAAPWQQTYVAAAFPIPAIGDARLPAADVLARLLLGDSTALLNKALRLDKKLVNAIHGSAMTLERVGLFYIAANLDPQNLPAFTTEFGSLFANLSANSFSDQDIARAKLNLEDNYLRGLETISDIADTMGDLYFFTPYDPTGAQYLTSIRDVTREQLQAVIDEWLLPEAMTMVALIPSSQIEATSKVAPEANTQISPETSPETGTEAAFITEQEALLIKLLNAAWPSKAVQGQNLAAKEAANNQPHIVELEKGCKLVLWLDSSLPFVYATLAFSGGDLLIDKPEKQGLTAVAASILTSATLHKTHEEMNTYLMDRASELSASSSLLDFTINLDAPSRFSEDIFALLKEVLTEPAFSQKDFARVLHEKSAGIIRQEDSAMGLMRRNLHSFLFPGTVHGNQIDGTQESLTTIKRADTLDFWAKQRRQPWVLTVVGDFDPDQIETFARALPQPDTARALVPPPIWNTEKNQTLKLPGREQAAYLMIFPTVSVNHEHSAALQLLSACLDGFSGLLFQELREKRSLGYSVSPVNWAGAEAGFLGFSIIAAPNHLQEAQENFIRIARLLGEELLPVDTVQRAKAMLEAEYFQRLQLRHIRADSMARHALYGRPLDFTQIRLEEMKALGPDDLREIARKYLTPENSYILQVTP